MSMHMIRLVKEVVFPRVYHKNSLCIFFPFLFTISEPILFIIMFFYTFLNKLRVFLGFIETYTYLTMSVEKILTSKSRSTLFKFWKLYSNEADGKAVGKLQLPLIMYICWISTAGIIINVISLIRHVCTILFARCFIVFN